MWVQCDLTLSSSHVTGVLCQPRERALLPTVNTTLLFSLHTRIHLLWAAHIWMTHIKMGVPHLGMGGHPDKMGAAIADMAR